ncbi:uncharacterized protein LOC143294549 [Babylonia areolata]|uniref:uncharacterized protein LOC143294549 n=1 Tax=Babylonia areolata TaxID=304850 RepID=UPI003FD015EB
MNITTTASSYPQPSEAVTHNDLCYNFTVSSVDPRVLQIAHLLTTFSVLDVGTSPDPDPDPDPDLSTAGLPSELISADMARLIETVVQAGILPVLVLWGLTTNLIDMVVFRRQGLNDRINIGLFSLALSDSGYLLMVFSSRVYSLLSLVDSQVGQFWKARSLVFVGLYTGFLNVSNVLTLLVSIDRCVCVVRPLKAKGLISARSTAKLVVVVFFVCLMCCGLACFKYDVITHVDPSTNVTSYRPTLTPFYRRHRDVIDAVFQYTMNVAVPTLSLLGVTVATSVIAVHMRRSLTWRKQATKTRC